MKHNRLIPNPILVRLVNDFDIAAAYAAIGRDRVLSTLWEIARIDAVYAARANKAGVGFSRSNDDLFVRPESFESLMALAGILAVDIPSEIDAICASAASGGRLIRILRDPLPGFVDPGLAWTLHALRLEAAESEAVAAREAVESAFHPFPPAFAALRERLEHRGLSPAQAHAKALALRAAVASGWPCDIPALTELAYRAAVELHVMERALARAAERQEAALKALPALDFEGMRRLYDRAIAEAEAWLARGGDSHQKIKLLLESFPVPDLEAAVAFSPRLRALLESAPALAAGRGRVVVLAARRRVA